MTRFNLTVETPYTGDPDADDAAAAAIVARLRAAAKEWDDLSITVAGEHEPFTVQIQRVSVPTRWPTDSDVIDRIAVGLATKPEWDRGELEWIANELSHVRPSVGDQDPIEYVRDFTEATGIDPATDPYGLQEFLSDAYHEAVQEEEQTRACADCGEVQPSKDDLDTYGGEDDLLCEKCRYERAVEESIPYPHEWSPSGARCTRSGCNVVGTGDPINDGNCPSHPRNPENPENIEKAAAVRSVDRED